MNLPRIAGRFHVTTNYQAESRHFSDPSYGPSNKRNAGARGVALAQYFLPSCSAPSRSSLQLADTIADIHKHKGILLYLYRVYAGGHKLRCIFFRSRDTFFDRTILQFMGRTTS